MDSYEQIDRALHDARQKMEEQDRFLAAISAAPRLYGTIVGEDEDGYVIASPGQADLLVNKTISADVGDIVTLQAETRQVLSVSKRADHATGITGHLVRDLNKEGQWLVQVTGSVRVAIIPSHRRFVKAPEPGDEVVLDASGYVVLRILQVDRSAFTASATGVTWDQIGGQEEAKAEIREAIHLLRGGDSLYRSYGAVAPKGVLLYGPPGCGKTLLGKAAATDLANDGEGAFLYVKAPEILDKYVGESEHHIRSIFRAAARHRDKTGQAAVVFIDEADAILQIRGSGISSDVEKTIVPTFLTEMDGLETSAALVILATNRADTLDPAVIRDGRIDRRILVDRPGPAQAEQILGLYLDGLPIREGETLNGLIEVAVASIYSGPSKLASLASGALLAGIVERAKRSAIRRDTGATAVSGICSADITGAIAAAQQEYA